MSFSSLNQRYGITISIFIMFIDFLASCLITVPVILLNVLIKVFVALTLRISNITVVLKGNEPKGGTVSL